MGFRKKCADSVHRRAKKINRVLKRASQQLHPHRRPHRRPATNAQSSGYEIERDPLPYRLLNQPDDDQPYGGVVPPHTSLSAEGDSLQPNPGPQQDDDPHNPNEPRGSVGVPLNNRPVPTGSSTPVTGQTPSSGTPQNRNTGSSADPSTSSGNRRDQPPRGRTLLGDGHFHIPKSPVSRQDDASPLTTLPKMTHPPPRALTPDPGPRIETSQSGEDAEKQVASEGGEPSLGDRSSAKGNSPEQNKSVRKGKAPIRGSCEDETSGGGEPSHGDRSSARDESSEKGKAPVRGWCNEEHCEHNNSSHESELSYSNRFWFQGTPFRREDSSRRDGPPRGGPAGGSATKLGDPQQYDENPHDGGHPQGDVNRQNYQPTPESQGQNQNNSQQSIEKVFPVCFSGVICNQAHPWPSLQNTPRAHMSLSYLCGGVTAPIRLSQDNVPFLFNEPSLMRYNDPRNPEELTWLQLLKLHDDSGQANDVRFMSLSDFLDSLSFNGSRHRSAYLDIKSGREAIPVAGSIQRVLKSRSHPLQWLPRVVICISNGEHVSDFGSLLAGHKIVLNATDLQDARILMNKHPLLHFKFNRKILISDSGQAFVAEAKTQGRDVYVETVNQVNEMKWSIRAGVTGIVTNHPGTLDGLYWECAKHNPDWMKLSLRSLVPPKRDLFASAGAQVKKMIPNSVITVKSATKSKARRDEASFFHGDPPI